MYPVSADFLTAISQNKRHTSARVTVNFDNLYIKRLLTATAANAADFGQVTQVLNTNANVAHWATCDGSWVLGSDYRIAPSANTSSSYEFGAWSANVTDSSGNLATPLEITVTPSSGNGAFDVENLGVAFDVIDNEYATDFTLVVTTTSGTQTITVTNNTAPMYLSGQGFSNVTEIDLTITKWNVSGHHAKVAEILFGESQTYTDSDIVEIDIIEELETAPTDGTGIGSVSANQITVSFNAQTVLFTTAQAQQGAQILPEIGVYLPDGSIEYCPMGVFYADTWDSSSVELETTITGYDILYSMSNTQHEIAAVTSDTLANIALALLDEYWSRMANSLDNALSNINISNWWVAPNDFRSAFQAVAFAANCYAYTDKNGILCILQKTDTTAVDNFDQDNIYSSTITKNVANSELDVYYYVPSVQNSGDVFSGTIMLTPGKTLTEEYSNYPAINLALVNSSYFSAVDLQSWQAELTVASNGAAGSYAVEITGQQINSTENECSETFALNGKTGTVTFQNDLVQTDTQAQALGPELAERINESLVSYAVTCQGNPALEVGDMVTAVLRTGTVTARIQTAEYTYQGYLKTVYTLKGAS
jgi:hypothetical protein